MGKQLALALVMVIALSAIAAISYAIGDRSDAVTTRAETAALSGAESDGLAPLADPVDLPVDTAPELVSTDVAADQAGGPREGIEVHGRWTIEVTEPDGTFVSLTEFDNALTTTGAVALGNFLAHNNSVGHWRIYLSGFLLSQPCSGSLGIPTACQITENAGTGPQISGGLSVEVPASGPNADKLVFSGSATIANSTSIRTVSTRVKNCDADTNPADTLTCAGPGITFTSTDLSPTVAVLADQVVNVTVVISFS